jgi:hypothetical protein
MKHTSGPWWVGRNTRDNVEESSACIFCRTVALKRRVLATMNYHFPHKEDALLISAAPDLLDACKRIVDNYEPGMTLTIEDYEAMRAAIAKAEGRTP